MIEFERDIDLEKYKTFFLSYYKDGNSYCSHLVRPCETPYEEIVDTRKFRTYVLDGAVIAFKHETTIAEMLVECAIRGISIDFIDVLVTDEASGAWSSSKEKCVQVIDTHVEDVSRHLDEYEAKRHYIAKNRSKKTIDNLKYLVVDRFSQSNDVKFLKGEYEVKGIIAGFKHLKDANEFCKKMNEIC